MNINAQLPSDHRPYTDKYFLRTNDIFKRAGINPLVSIKVFARGTGRVAGLKETVEVIKRYSDLHQHNGEVWITKKGTFTTTDTLLVIKAPVQSIVELETMYLGVLSHHLTVESKYKIPDPEKIQQKMLRLKEIYENKNIIYFGARHYHWSFDKEIAAAAFAGGANQTSTDIGSSHIRKEGVGTMPHILILVLASVYGKEQAVLKAVELFDMYIPEDIPRVTLVDTFNREITDSLRVARYFETRKHALRIDTCGENIGEGGTRYYEGNEIDPTYKTGKGVTIELVSNVKMGLIKSGYGDSADIFLSSGFGNEKKARAFMDADKMFKQKTGYALFTGVGIGEVSEGGFATADVFEVDNKPLAKTGREIDSIDYSRFERII